LQSWVICRKPVRQAAAAVLDSPHSGRVYPADFGYACPKALLEDTEDAYVDELFGAAPALGLPLLAAAFPRCYIDPNRAEDDIDPLLLEAPWPGKARPSPRSDLGTGLVRRLLKNRGGTPIYDRRLSVAEIRRRIETCYLPYHKALETLLNDTYMRFGAVWHLNCHSMPALGLSTSPDIVLGDRDGESCAGSFTRYVASCLKRMGYRVAINDPYKGVEILRRHGDPRQQRHSLQIEICRALYLDEATHSKSAGFAQTRDNMTQLIRQIAEFAVENTPGKANAAE
jgi:N-formylglutamate amidohydrolase